MKKISLKVSVVLLAGAFVCSSCIGSFSLFNKYEKWQCNMTSNKMVNGIVGLILQPFCAPVCCLVDAVVLNTIEFWSGSNPLASNTIQQVKGQDGRYYAVKTTKQGYEIKSPTGEVTLLIHNEADDSWSMSQNGVTTEIFRYNADGTIQASLQNGQTITVSADQAGLEQVRQAVDGTCYAMR
ncbi:MAG: DUF3332 domain-containing protein [Prevotella sp.]|nr:DUF3332 domain-containing protein [Prevotella sp.]